MYVRHIRHGVIGMAGAVLLALAARGESPAAFERRCIPKLPTLGHFLQGSNTAGMLPRRALHWPDAALSTTPQNLFEPYTVRTILPNCALSSSRPCASAAASSG